MTLLLKVLRDEAWIPLAVFIVLALLWCAWFVRRPR
jgi:hypothetical protein